VALGALALSTLLAVAREVSSGDKVYDVHSEAQGTCPSLNWHIVASPSGVLTGMIACDNMKVVALVSGTMERPVQIGRNPQPSNAQYREFSMIANEQGGIARRRSQESFWKTAGSSRTFRALAWPVKVSRCDGFLLRHAHDPHRPHRLQLQTPAAKAEHVSQLKARLSCARDVETALPLARDDPDAQP
jgi:hypothetical protein